MLRALLWTLAKILSTSSSLLECCRKVSVDHELRKDRGCVTPGPVRLLRHQTRNLSCMVSFGVVIPLCLTMSSRLALRNYQRSYCKDGQIDKQHLSIFSALKRDFFDGDVLFKDASPKVLYPGCHRHITPSLVFPDITYVDSDKKVGDIFDIENNSFVREWLSANSEYEYSATTTNIRFIPTSYADMKAKRHKLALNSFDLLISLSAGIVTHDGLGFLRPGGHYLVNASHADAMVANLQPSLRLRAYWDEEKSIFRQDKDMLDELFMAREKGNKKRSRDTDDGYVPMSHDQVDEAVRVGTKSKRSFVLKREPMMYVFEKVGAE